MSKEKSVKIKLKLVRQVIAVLEILTIMMVPPRLKDQTRVMVKPKSMMENAGKSISAFMSGEHPHLLHLVDSTSLVSMKDKYFARKRFLKKWPSLTVVPFF